MIHSENSQKTTLANNRYEDLNVSSGGYNYVTLAVKDRLAVLFLNNNYAGTVNVPQQVIGGTIAALAGYYSADETGIPILFENFSI